MASSSTLRITREIAELKQGSDLSLSVAFREDNVRNVRALIIGPPDTPYEFGFFELKIKCSDKYPHAAPSVKFITTNGGKSRFNPNIYACGKVCLSILGTWRGEPGEEWSTAQGLESILLSIQSLMSSNPYENEPGFEGTRLEDEHATAYAAKVRHEALRVTVIQRLETLLKIPIADDSSTADVGKNGLATFHEHYLGGGDGDDDDDDDPGVYDASAGLFENSHDSSFDPFADLYKQRFLWYYDAYIQSIEKASEAQKDNKRFSSNQFEYPGNELTGKFAYKSLKSRLQHIRKALDNESESWASQGLRAMKDERNCAVDLKRQFEQTSEYYKHLTCRLNIEISLVENNPFVWHLTFFGEAGSDLYGATINVRICLSPLFPAEQPRVTVLTPLFHHRISSSPCTNGRVLVYFPDQSKQHDVRFHIEAIISAIAEENPAYDPRTLINLEAAALLWGGEEKRKIYRRRLRRSVQESMENMDEF
ncbi:hypothetical protein MBLNU459_g6787t1 [Dothideomycetes sp. NU459]